MTTTVTKTVKSAGGDYSSLSAWEAGQQGDLTISDTIQQAECYSFHDSTEVTIDGWTTSATQYIRIYAPSTERHNGTWNTSKYYLSADDSGGANRLLGIFEEFTRVEGLQVQNTGASGTSIQVSVGSPSDVRITESIARSLSKSGVGIQAGGTVLVQNCVVFDCTYGVYAASGTTTIYNSTIANCNYGVLIFGAVVGKNLYVGNCSTQEYFGTPTLTTCMHSSGSSYTGSTGSVAYSTANFTNVTSGSEDLHLVSGSALKDAGTDLSATFTTDIDGQTRPTGAGTWDIGADEYQAPAAGMVFNRRSRRVNNLLRM